MANAQKMLCDAGVTVHVGERDQLVFGIEFSFDEERCLVLSVNEGDSVLDIARKLRKFADLIAAEANG